MDFVWNESVDPHRPGRARRPLWIRSPSSSTSSPPLRCGQGRLVANAYLWNNLLSYDARLAGWPGRRRRQRLPGGADVMAGFEFSVQEETPVAGTAVMDVAPLQAPELSFPRRWRVHDVAEIERLRCCGVNRLQDLNVAAAAAMLEAAAAASAQENSVLLHHHDHLPAFYAATGARYYSPNRKEPEPALQSLAGCRKGLFSPPRQPLFPPAGVLSRWPLVQLVSPPRGPAPVDAAGFLFVLKCMCSISLPNFELDNDQACGVSCTAAV